MGKPKTTPRKRPKQERAQATVESILEATARVLTKEGFDRASTNRIAEEAGVSVGSLYQYFPSKEALVAALMERHIEEMGGIIDRALGRLAEARLADAARETVRLMIAAHSVDPALHKVLMEQVPRIGRMQRFHDVEARAVELVRAFLEVHRAELRVQDLDLAAQLAVLAVEGITHTAVINRPDLLAHPRLEEELTELVLRYLARPVHGLRKTQ